MVQSWPWAKKLVQRQLSILYPVIIKETKERTLKFELREYVNDFLKIMFGEFYDKLLLTNHYFFKILSSIILLKF